MTAALTAILLCLTAGILYTVISPLPVILLLRRKMSGEADLKYPPDYQDGGVIIQKELIYPSKYAKNKYDLYLPENTGKKAPVILWIHGGGFIAGSKSGVKNWGMLLAQEGYAVAAADYQYAPEIAYPNQLRQIQEFIEALKQEAKSGLLVDMHRVYLAGDSAGAHIAAQCALLAANPAFAQAVGVSSSLSLEDLKAVLLYCGPYDVESVLNMESRAGRFLVGKIGWGMFGTYKWRKSPLLKTTTIKNFVTQDFPPAFITDGNKGSFEKEGKELAKCLEACSVTVDGLFFDSTEGDIGHEYQYDLSGRQGYACYRETLKFLAAVEAMEAEKQTAPTKQ